MGEFARQAGAGEPLCQMAQGQAPFCKQGLSPFDGAAAAGSRGLGSTLHHMEELLSQLLPGDTFIHCCLLGVGREHILSRA